ncbi:hypothetical protein CROQUDRAFT_43294, partial [Cronartium quercuum f. sp. fusiforme G11]
LSADFIHRTHKCFAHSSTQAPIEFLSQFFPDYHHNKLSQLWYFTYHSLNTAFLDTSSLFFKWGIPQSNQPNDALSISEVTLLPLVQYCFVCDPNKHHKLHSKEQVYGYLYNMDSIKSVQYLNYNFCSNQPCGSSFQPTYYTRVGLHLYYTIAEGQSEVLFQVSTHYFMTHVMAHQHNMW